MGFLIPLILFPFVLQGCAGGMIRLPAAVVAGDEWLLTGGSAAGTSSRPTGPEPPLRLRWQQQMDGGPLGGTRVSGGIVMVLTKKSSLYAFDARSGQLVDRATLDEFACSPLLLTTPSHLLVYSELGRSPALVSFLRRGGKRLWSAEGSACTPSTAVDDTLFVSFEGARLAALAADDGRQLWQWQGDGGLHTEASVRGRYVLIGDAEGTLSALSTHAGETVWQVELDSGVRSRPLIVESRVFVGTSAGIVYALDLHTGRELWNADVGGLPSPGMAHNGRVLAVGSVDGHIYGLAPETGGLTWRVETSGIVRSTPVATSSTVYGASNDGTVYAVDSQTGAVRWRHDLGVPVIEPLVIGMDALIVGAESGVLYAFSR